MLLSLSWLREFTPYEGDAASLGERLTMLGLELEEILHPFDNISGITTGHVVTCAPHPDSDHLHVCQVDVGQEAVLDIVCGAPNVAQGQKVCVATIGTTLPDGTLIKKSKLRGQPSYGMICSERELGLSEDHSGIMVLPSDTPVGQRLVDVLPLDRDVLNLSITPNRADCLSVVGLARETAMSFHLPFTIPEKTLVCTGEKTELPITIASPDLCWLYAGRILSGLAVAPSPAAIRYRLKAVGIRPLSNIVDVTNYILMECGQPLHAFDLNTLEGRQIIVRNARLNERLVTLDGQERTLLQQDLCICDEKRPVALAGVMGGLESEITDATTTVFVESAVFHPGTIRKTSRRLGLSSEASFRFERGIDQERTIWALDRACAMLLELCGGCAHATVHVQEPRAFVPAKISFRPSSAQALLGVPIERDFVTQVLTGIGCGIRTLAEEDDLWEVTQPSWRPDVTREADLIEEVGRVYGLDAIPPAMPPRATTLETAVQPESVYEFWLRLRHWARGIGFRETINYSFVGHADLDRLHLPKESRISILNPLSADQNVLRPVLAPGLLSAVATNLAQSAQHLALFELANVFTDDPSSETHAREEGRLGLLVTGLRNEAVWPFTPEDMGYEDLRGVIEHLATSFHLARPEFTPYEGEHPYLLPAVSVAFAGETLGVLGRVRPEIALAYYAHKEIWLAELATAPLQAQASAKRPQFTPLALYPAIRRDVTLIGGADLTVGQVLSHIASRKHPFLEDVAFVSLFEPEGSHEKHLSFRLTFRHPKRTLKDGEVDKERTALVQSLVDALGVRV